MKDVNKFVQGALEGREELTVGLGSGSAAKMVVEEMGVQAKNSGVLLEGIPSSTQIAIAASLAGFKILAPSELHRIDMVIDGADQLAEGGLVIKGGGGALTRERILWESSQKIHLFVRKERCNDKPTFPLPVEFLPFSTSLLKAAIEKRGMQASLRTNEKGYPFVTENGNFIFDVSYDDVKSAYSFIRNLPGVLDVGLFIYNMTVHIL